MRQFYRKAIQRMTSRRRRALVAAILGAIFVTTLVSADSHLNNLRPFDDPTGRVRTVSTSGEAGLTMLSLEPGDQWPQLCNLPSGKRRMDGYAGAHSRTVRCFKRN